MCLVIFLFQHTIQCPQFYLLAHKVQTIIIWPLIEKGLLNLSFDLSYYKEEQPNPFALLCSETNHSVKVRIRSNHQLSCSLVSKLIINRVKELI